MTYCVGMKLSRGLVFMSDTRTNAGIDNISTVKKMKTWSVPGDRVITLLSAGNLATTQSVISLIDEHNETPENRVSSLVQVPTMFQAANQVGALLKKVIQSNANSGQEAESSFNATLILGGQIANMPPRLFLIYPEGNFIEAMDDNPYLLIGETKYGRPILVRAFDPEMSFEEAVKLLLVSFDSTMKANLSVGMPLDLMTYKNDTLETGPSKRINPRDSYFRNISTGWGDALQAALNALPEFKFD